MTDSTSSHTSRDRDADSVANRSPLPDYTIVIEWENAIDVEMRWVERGLEALEAELIRTQGRTAQRPRILYLFDETVVDAKDITDAIERAAPRIPDLVDLELVPTPGLSYYDLKNHGAQLAKTDLFVMLDSDAAPLEGWLDGLLRPFADPEVMCVAGFTALGHDNFISKTMALVWVFDLPSERAETVKKQKIHANNCAFRTEFFQANPWPQTPVTKKATGIWLQDIVDRGIRWVRTDQAMTRHAPHPGYAFLAWRAWAMGRDRDYTRAQKFGRFGRIVRSLVYWGKKMVRSTWRILSKHREVELPVHLVPGALVLAWSYYTIVFVSQTSSAIIRSHAR